MKIELINNDGKKNGAIIAVVDFLNPLEVKTIIKSIRDLHKSVMKLAEKENESFDFEEKTETIKD